MKAFVLILVSLFACFVQARSQEDFYLRVDCKIDGKPKGFEVDKVLVQDGTLLLQERNYPERWAYHTVAEVPSTDCEIKASDYHGVLPGH